MNAKALSIMRCQDDINTEHNMKSIGHAAVAQWTKRLTRNGQTRVRIRKAHIFDISHITLNVVSKKLLLPSGLEFMSESSESGALSLSSAARHIDFHLLRRIYVALITHSIALSLHIKDIQIIK